MKRQIALLATSFALLAAPCADAQGAVGLTATDIFEIRQFVPNADLSGVTPKQALAIRQLLHDGDGFDTAYRIRSILLRTPPQG